MHYVVAEHPAPLAGMAYPDPQTRWDSLHEAGFRHVVRLHAADYDPAPLVAHDVVLEDLHGGRSPSDPDVERELVRDAARFAAERVAAGDGVVVHCVGGTGRTGTVLACALVNLGLTPEEAVRRVQAHRPRWPESPWQQEVVTAAGRRSRE